MQPKIHRHVLCAKNVITILEEHKTGGLFCPPSDFTGGAKQPPCFGGIGESPDPTKAAYIRN